jgi:hypothetical protein
MSHRAIEGLRRGPRGIADGAMVRAYLGYFTVVKVVSNDRGALTRQ